MDYKLVIDNGNTRTKIAVFEGDLIRELFSVSKKISTPVSRIVKKYGMPSGCIVSHVHLGKDAMLSALEAIPEKLIVFTSIALRLPVKVTYQTPLTLGHDRLANACGAWKLNPGKNTLVIDMGTCIKYDYVNSSSEYTGGSISPGLEMRYKALARFTGQLPYFKPVVEFPGLTGQSTEGAIRSGVENGILEELRGILRRYSELTDQTHIIITGGDHSKFADQLKSPIFVAPNLTLTGLKVILDHNDPS